MAPSNKVSHVILFIFHVPGVAAITTNKWKFIVDKPITCRGKIFVRFKLGKKLVYISYSSTEAETLSEPKAFS